VRRDKALEAKIVVAVAAWYDLKAQMCADSVKAALRAERDECLEHLRGTFRQNERKKA
jgi:hypothetical protein